MTRFFLFSDPKTLVKVVDHAKAFRFDKTGWTRADSFRATVSGHGGDSDFETLTEAEAKKLFPAAFR